MWFVISATSITPTTPARGERREQPEDEHRARTELGEAGEPGVQDAGLHAEAREPPAGAGDLAAAEDVVVAVGEHHDARPSPAEQRGSPRCTPSSASSPAPFGPPTHREPIRTDAIVSSIADRSSHVWRSRMATRRTSTELRPVRGLQPERRDRRGRGPVPDVRAGAGDRPDPQGGRSASSTWRDPRGRRVARRRPTARPGGTNRRGQRNEPRRLQRLQLRRACSRCCATARRSRRRVTRR